MQTDTPRRKWKILVTDLLTNNTIELPYRATQKEVGRIWREWNSDRLQAVLTFWPVDVVVQIDAEKSMKSQKQQSPAQTGRPPK